jgi:cobalt/nickel transport system permease protein
VVNLIKERFSEGDSPLHRLDPRVKIIVVLFFSVIVAVTDKYTSLSGALLFAVIAVAVARLKTKKNNFPSIGSKQFYLFIMVDAPLYLSR